MIPAPTAYDPESALATNEFVERGRREPGVARLALSACPPRQQPAPSHPARAPLQDPPRPPRAHRRPPTTAYTVRWTPSGRQAVSLDDQHFDATGRKREGKRVSRGGAADRELFGSP